MSLTVYKRGKIWHYSGTVAGTRLRGSTHTSDKQIARRLAAEFEDRRWKGHLDGPGSLLTFSQAIALYEGAGKPTRFLPRLSTYWKDMPVRHITPSAVRECCQRLYPTAGPATWNRQVIAPTQAVINHAAEQELCSPLRVRRWRIVRREKEPATWEWVQAFMRSAGTPHLAALACFMFLTGARISEALAVTWSDVDLENRRVLIRQTKVASERLAHLPLPLLAALAGIEGDRIGRVFRFRSRSNCKTQWDGAIRRAEIKYLTPHALRHGFATAALRAGIDVRTVAELGGWKTPALVLSTYSHALRDPTLTDRLIGRSEIRTADAFTTDKRQRSCATDCS